MAMSKTFTELGIGEPLTQRLEGIGIKTATPVQERVIPLVMEGRNILFQSETGTGKTFAYLLPLLQRLFADEEDDRRVRLLIVSPTLELCSQIRDQVKLCTDRGCALLVGGVPISRQVEKLKEKPSIVIGSSSRLLELIHLKKLKTDGIEALVLDEADRLLSPELRESTEGMIARLNKDVQLIGNSATVSAYTKKIITSARIKDEIELVEMPAEDILRSRIEHWALFAERRDKIDTLRSFIRAVTPQKMLVFTSRLDQVENIVSKLRYKHIDCEGLGAKADKKKRKAAWDKFKGGSCKILVTTDVAARGLDIAGVTHVVQMDLVEERDVFIHRAGRTGRAGRKGFNCVIGDEWEMRRFAAFEKKLGLTVYPKMLFKGRLIAPQQQDAEAPSDPATRPVQKTEVSDSPTEGSGRQPSGR